MWAPSSLGSLGAEMLRSPGLELRPSKDLSSYLCNLGFLWKAAKDLSDQTTYPRSSQ